MNTVRDWQASIDDADQVAALRAVLHELSGAITDLEDSPYAEEDALQDQLHNLELVREHGERKLERMLE
jgi:hypothetical protein